MKYPRNPKICYKEISHNKHESGNILFLILIAVILFAALSFAVTYSSNSSFGTTEGENQKMSQAVLNNCETAINIALLRLRGTGGCDDSELNYELPDGTNANPQAPADGHCNVFHPLYGGATPCGAYTEPGCDLTALPVGGSCDGVVYAGESSGKRIYTATADHSNGITWNNASMSLDDTPADSTSDGKTNTSALSLFAGTDVPYLAAQLCLAQGSKWYLPSRDELLLLYANKASIGGFSDTGPADSMVYWSSSEEDSYNAFTHNFGSNVTQGRRKDLAFSIRCVRQD